MYRIIICSLFRSSNVSHWDILTPPGDGYKSGHPATQVSRGLENKTS